MQFGFTIWVTQKAIEKLGKSLRKVRGSDKRRNFCANKNSTILHQQLLQRSERINLIKMILALLSLSYYFQENIKNQYIL